MTYYDDMSDDEFEDFCEFVASVNENAQVHIRVISIGKVVEFISAMQRVQHEQWDKDNLRIYSTADYETDVSTLYVWHAKYGNLNPFSNKSVKPVQESPVRQRKGK